MDEADWLEAFACHPRIGERKAHVQSAQSAAWSRQEQAGRSRSRQDSCANSPKAMQTTNSKFGFTYIVCATGKSAEEMLAILKRRLASDR